MIGGPATAVRRAAGAQAEGHAAMLADLIARRTPPLPRRTGASRRCRHPVSRHAVAVAFGAALAVSPALAHHGWSSYDAGTVVVIEGPILRANYAFPHAEIELAHEGRNWEIVLAPPSRMQARGLPAGAIVTGAVVRVEGYPSTVHEAELRAETITVAGKTIPLR